MSRYPADHDGVVVSFNLETEKQPPKTKIIYDYKNADIDGLLNYFKTFDFETNVFSKPIIEQTDVYSNILTDAFTKFVPCKSVTIRPTDQAWCNAYTRLLLRKKNRNYLLYKKCNLRYVAATSQPYANPEIVTRLLNQKNKAFKKSRDAANESTKANSRAKASFHNTMNATLRNNSISAKKKFSILLKLMKNNKFSTPPPFN